MGLTGIYNPPVSDEDGIAVIKHAFSKGITFFDTSDIYGADHANEILVAKVRVYKDMLSSVHDTCVFWLVLNLVILWPFMHIQYTETNEGNSL